MISVSYKVPVNPEGTDVALSRADVWKGLEAKAHNALPYVPSMTYCEVTDEGENWLQREIEFRGQKLGERITFEPQDTVRFDRTSGEVMGTILNEILETEDGELELRFSFDLELEGVEAGSKEESDYEATMKGDYEKAVESTLAAIRRWVGEGAPLEA
jgi:hypothetical protein